MKNEFPLCLKFLCATRLNSTRIVKYIACVTFSFFPPTLNSRWLRIPTCWLLCMYDLDSTCWLGLTRTDSPMVYEYIRTGSQACYHMYLRLDFLCNYRPHESDSSWLVLILVPCDLSAEPKWTLEYQTHCTVHDSPCDWRTQVHHWCCAHLADTMFRWKWIFREVLWHTSIDRLSLTWSTVRSNSWTKVWTTYLLSSPINLVALHCITDPL